MNHVGFRFLAKLSAFSLPFLAACSERGIDNEQRGREDAPESVLELMDALQPPSLPTPTVPIEDATLAQLWAMGVELLRWDSAGPPEGATADEVRLRLIEEIEIRDYWDGLGYPDNPVLGEPIEIR